MRMNLVWGLAAVVAAMMSGCAGSPSAERAPLSFPLNCRADENAAECLRTVSEMCGARGYDLFDANEQPITVAELKYGKATARCRPADADD